jgi:hypothetical protein
MNAAREATTAPVAPKLYVPPRLIRYGSIVELTRELGCFVNKDSGSNAICRRSP